MRAPRNVPLPQHDDLSGPFWSACAGHRLTFQRCKSCGTFQSVPRRFCSNCRAEDFDWVESEGKGRIFTYTVVHHPPSPALSEEVPYIVIVVELDDCGQVLLISNLVGEEAMHVAIGGPVRLCWDDVAGTALPRFELA